MDRDYIAPKGTTTKESAKAAKPTSKAAKAVTRKTPTTTKAKAAKAKPKASSASKASATVKADIDPALTPLNERQKRFVEEYLVDLNGAQAAIRAGYSAKTARHIAAENLAKPNIQAAIAEGRRKQQERTEISADRVLREAWNQVTADARELSALEYHACRYCHGIDGKYQWRTESEFEEELTRVVLENSKRESDNKRLLPEPSDEGGFGYSTRLDPSPDCQHCDGYGVPRMVLGDTRRLSKEALSLYAGTKQTRYGIEVQVHSKDAAMERLFKHLGLYQLDNQQKTDPLASLLQGIASTNGNSFRPVAEDPDHHQDKAGSTLPIAQDGEQGED